MRKTFLPLVLVLLAVLGLMVPLVAHASDPFLEVPPADVVDAAPAFRYAHMTGEEALEELRRRKILFQRVPQLGRVQTPIRLTGRLHGVHLHSSLPEAERPTTLHEICDARFALALDDFAAILEKHDIVEAVHFTIYRGPPPRPQARGAGTLVPFLLADGGNERGGKLRAVNANEGSQWAPGSRLASDPSSILAKSGKNKPKKPRAVKRRSKPKSKGKKVVQSRSKRKRVSKARSRTRRRGPENSRHPEGLAIDLGAFRKRDGQWLSVAGHFRGRIGAKTCGAGVKPPKGEQAHELWSIVCEAYEAKVFTYVLTPNYDRPHQDHFHMEIKPGVRWFLYH